MFNAYQRSKYNFFAQTRHGILGFNARTGHFAILAEDIVKQLLSNQAIGKIRNREDLLELGFIHLGNELEEIRVKFFQYAKFPKRLMLTILPTLQCNRNCIYCYQADRRHNKLMSAETRNRILEWVENYTREEGVKFTSCTWFGGEPLLAKELVFDISRCLQKICRQGGGSLRMQIVTNATLLDELTAKTLSEVGITHAQVTFDSVIDDGHKKRGVLRDEEKRSSILENIKVADRYLNIGIRVNVGSYNQGEVTRILQELCNNGFRGRYSLARIMNSENQNLNQHPHVNNSNIINDEVFALLENTHMWSKPEYRSRLLRRLTPLTKNCSSHTGKMLVIDPEGSIYSCWHEAGLKPRAFGNINNQNKPIFDEKRFQRWANYDPFSSVTCCECNILPLCMGGCMHDRLIYGIDQLFCSPLKYNIQFQVDQVAEHIEECKNILA